MTRLHNPEGTRQFRAHPFVAVPRETIEDHRLSWKARGLLAFLLNLPEDWTLHSDWLEKQSDKDGRDAMTAGLRELRIHGYYRLERRHLADGTFRTGSAFSDVARPDWAAEHAAATLAAQARTGKPGAIPRWDTTVRVHADGTVEEIPLPGADQAERATGNGSTGDGKPVPGTGNGLTGDGKPVPLDRHTNQDTERTQVEKDSHLGNAREGSKTTPVSGRVSGAARHDEGPVGQQVAPEIRHCGLCNGRGIATLLAPCLHASDVVACHVCKDTGEVAVDTLCVHDAARNLRAVTARRQARAAISRGRPDHYGAAAPGLPQGQNRGVDGPAGDVTAGQAVENSPTPPPIV